MRGSGDAVFVVIMMVMLIASVAAILIVGLTLRYRRRELQHKERLAAMEKGAPLPALTDFEQRTPWTPRMYLLRGLMWLFGGIGLTLFLLAVSIATYQPRSPSDRAVAAQRMKDFGGSEEQIREVLTSLWEGLPPGFSVLGLMPIGVGLAYLIVYRVEVKNTH